MGHSLPFFLSFLLIPFPSLPLPPLPSLSLPLPSPPLPFPPPSYLPSSLLSLLSIFFPLQVRLFVPHDGQHCPFLWKDKDILFLQVHKRQYPHKQKMGNGKLMICLQFLHVLGVFVKYFWTLDLLPVVNTHEQISLTGIYTLPWFSS